MFEMKNIRNDGLPRCSQKRTKATVHLSFSYQNADFDDVGSNSLTKMTLNKRLGKI